MMHLERLSESMSDQGIDAAIVYQPQDLVMLADHYPHWNGSVLLVQPNKQPMLFIPDFEPAVESCQCLVRRYSWGGSKTNPWDNLLALIRDGLPAEPRIALDLNWQQAAPSSNAGEGGILPPEFFQLLLRVGTHVDLHDRLADLRLFKTTEQIASIEKVHRVAKTGIKAFFAAEEGMRDGELAALIEYHINKQIGLPGVHYVRAYASVQSGPDTELACQYNRTGRRTLADGDWVFLELAVCVNGYWFDVTRMTVVGEPSNRQQELFSIVKCAVDTAIEVCKPGVTKSTVYGAAMDVFKAHGLGHLFPHALGHGTGFAYHDPGVSLHQNNDEPLKVGQVVTIEPGLYGEEVKGGIRIEENIVITEHGARNLSVPQAQLKEL
ncbi:Xaa-Pro peptidase family protein [Photobacterium sp. ZSDE20]|uniref:Xaa-Pro peptidase family protein n=1 Tax=Photobacterium pectinilyticum TaxID=2906793 RepID=A0ABT1N954_9GAMM|nr:Xaa-Pro peptidase family protein [Photobacterium sp. ZSDE20]MCQ1061266.1 Xaa-Pro peptidase family protein [Photobacterium sp. ZSDE20]MDD1829762.1 Xaa-Pro peptidase family protein [Photobacterium sp. ZSDE20]